MEKSTNDQMNLKWAVIDFKNIIKKYNLTLAEVNQIIAMVCSDDKFFNNRPIPKS
jgi:hypothetical protein